MISDTRTRNEVVAGTKTIPLYCLTICLCLLFFFSGCYDYELALAKKGWKLKELEEASRKPPPPNFTGTWEEFYQNGRKAAETKYVDGVMNGTKTVWYPDIFHNKWREETYKDGVLNGVYRRWDDTSNLLLEQYYKNGILEGRSVEWHSNGNKHLEKTYKNGKRNGESIFWHIKGYKQLVTTFKNDIIVGKRYSYYPNGKIRAISEYSNGVALKKTSYDKKGNVTGVEDNPEFPY